MKAKWFTLIVISALFIPTIGLGLWFGIRHHESRLHDGLLGPGQSVEFDKSVKYFVVVGNDGQRVLIPIAEYKSCKTAMVFGRLTVKCDGHWFVAEPPRDLPARKVSL
jgi:hypothetical protein